MAGESIETITTASKFAAIKEEWDDLWSDSDGAYFHAFDCCWWSWVSIHEPSGRSLHITVLRDGGLLVAALPMVHYWKGPWKVAKSLGPVEAEGCDILARRDGSCTLSAAAGLWSAFIQDARPHLIVLPFVRRGSVLDAVVATSTGCRVTRGGEDYVPYACLGNETDWKSYKDSLSKIYQSKVGRKRRRLSEMGALTLERVTDSPSSSADWLLRHKRRWGDLTGKRGSWLYSEHYQVFLCQLSEQSQHVLTFAMHLDGKTIAVKIVSVGSRFCTLVIGSYDQDYGKFSPGTVLDEFWMQYVFENYRTSDGRHLDVDFGAGQEIYKTHWSRGNQLETRSLEVATSPWGATARHLQVAMGGLKALAARAKSLRSGGAGQGQVAALPLHDRGNAGAG